MATNVIEKLFIQIGVDSSEFEKGIDKVIAKNDELNKTVKDTEGASKKSGEATIKTAEKHRKASYDVEKLGKTIAGVTKGFIGLFTTVMVSSGLNRFIDQAQRTNNELFFLEKNLGLSSGKIKSWQNVAKMSGGSSEGLTASLKNLNRAMNNFVMMGDTSMLPYFNALGVSMVDGAGKLRNLDDVLLDLSDSLSQMDRQQAVSIASAIGFDEGTTNMLLRGRKELSALLKEQDRLYKSNKNQLDASRKLSETQAKVNANWERLKTIIGNSLIPVLIKLYEHVDRFLVYLQENEGTVIKVFQGIAAVISAVMIPILLKMAVAGMAAIAPILPMIVAVGALAAAFIGLYDDYQTWAEGGESLFDWTGFGESIQAVTGYVKELWKSIKDLVSSLLKELQPVFDDFVESIKLLHEGDIKGFMLKRMSAGNHLWAKFNKGFYSAAESGARFVGLDSLGDWLKNANEASQGWHNRQSEKLDKNFKEHRKSLGKDDDSKNNNSSGVESSSNTPFPTIDGFTAKESKVYAEALARRESSNVLDKVNSYGYTGLYQFGASALAEVGFIDRQKFDEAERGVKNGSNAEKHKEFLENPDNWLIGNYEEYKNSKELQDLSLKRLTEINLRRGKNVHGGDKAKMFGFAMAAHLKGSGNASKWYGNKIDSKDGYGTKTSSYAKLGENAYNNHFGNNTANQLLKMFASLFSDKRSVPNAPGNNLVANPNTLPKLNDMVNKSISITLNGGVHVNSSADRIDGTVADGFGAVRSRYAGLITGLH